MTTFDFYLEFDKIVVEKYKRSITLTVDKVYVIMLH